MRAKASKDIFEGPKENKFLYKELVDKLIRAEEPTKEEERAIRENDEICNEEELFRALN